MPRKWSQQTRKPSKYPPKLWVTIRIYSSLTNTRNQRHNIYFQCIQNTDWLDLITKLSARRKFLIASWREIWIQLSLKIFPASAPSRLILILVLKDGEFQQRYPLSRKSFDGFKQGQPSKRYGNKVPAIRFTTRVSHLGHTAENLPSFAKNRWQKCTWFSCRW